MSRKFPFLFVNSLSVSQMLRTLKILLLLSGAHCCNKWEVPVSVEPLLLWVRLPCSSREFSPTLCHITGYEYCFHLILSVFNRLFMWNAKYCAFFLVQGIQLTALRLPGVRLGHWAKLHFYLALWNFEWCFDFFSVLFLQHLFDRSQVLILCVCEIIYYLSLFALYTAFRML